MQDSRYCIICPNNELNSEQHKTSIVHRYNFAVLQYTEYRKALVHDRHGITIEVKPKFQNNLHLDFKYERRKGKYIANITAEQLLLHKKITFKCTLYNKGKQKIYLTSANFLHQWDVFKIIYDKSLIFGYDKDYILALESDSSYTFEVEFSVKQITTSRYPIPIIWNFQTLKNDTFTILRTIVVCDAEASHDKKANKKSPFTCKTWMVRRTIPSEQRLYYSNKYPIPQDYMRILQLGLQSERFKYISDNELNTLTALRTLMDTGLNPRNYNDYWHIVLWLEEVGQTLMLERYNMEEVPLSVKQKHILVLEVPGLAERRPSVIVGDLIDIKLSEGDVAYTGVVKRVNDKTVDIHHVNQELVYYITCNPEDLFDVKFSLSRLSFERMHEAVDKMAGNMLEVIFPKSVNFHVGNGAVFNLSHFSFYNEEIKDNYEQSHAVLNIVNHSQPYPYIVFGPPGTGKTVTIVEAILQIKDEFPNSRILVCAPANSACDNIAIMLMQHCTPSELLRIHSDSRETSTLTEELREYSNIGGENDFIKTSLDKIKRFRIIVTTLTLIGRYRDYNPDYIFVDEAAQASEPEVAIALGFLKFGKQVVLAGDPKQLGPMVSSKCAEKYGLGVSLLERLMEYDVYQRDSNSGLYDNNFITMLVANFRSHIKILDIPNELFYDKRLVARSLKAFTDPIVSIAIFRQSHPQRNKGKVYTGDALEFCSVNSRERREGSSPSYYNMQEARQVLKYVQTLMNLDLYGEHKVQLKDIGVITPYKRQVYKILELLKSNGFEGVEVGTTEAYQGREKRIIIISTVRAQDSLLLHDKKYNLGFVRDDKRFNVAVTRAISKLIVIGCQKVLCTDPKWNKFIQSCRQSKTYFGAPYFERTEEWKNDVVDKMRHFKSRDDQYSQNSSKQQKRRF